MSINKRIFGSDIPNGIKKKLESMQKVSDKTVKPGDSINLKNVYDIDGNKIDNVTTGDYISNNFSGLSDLSSRTPFIRMWTAVEVLEEPLIDGSEINEEKHAYLEILEAGKYVPNLHGKNVKKIMKSQEDLQKRQSLYYLDGKVVWIPDNDGGTGGKYAIVKNHELREKYIASKRSIYIVGNHILNTLDDTSIGSSKFNQNKYEGAPVPPTKASTGMHWPSGKGRDTLHEQGLKNTATHFFPNEHGVTGDGNKFLKPEAGIINMESSTQNMLGSVRITTINFEVHNFADFDAIFNRYFLKPAAQIFIDFGWDTTRLYDPELLLDDQETNIEDALYGDKQLNKKLKRNGYVTDANGDMDTFVGLVTGYNSKINPNGTVQCTLTINSKNRTLEGFKAYEGISAKVKYLLEKSIYWEAMLRIGGQTGTGKTFKSALNWKVSDKSIMWFSRPNANTSAESKTDYETQLIKLAQDSFLHRDYNPTIKSAISGVHFVGDKKYISWGLLEDRILNEEFGFGFKDNKRKLGTNINSTLSYTHFNPKWISRQGNAVEFQPSSKIKFLIPHFWDYTFGNVSSNVVDNYGEENDQNVDRQINQSFKSTYGDDKESMEKYRETFIKYFNEDYREKLSKLSKELDEIELTGEEDSFSKIQKEYFEKRKEIDNETRFWDETTKPPWTIYDKIKKRVPIRDVFISTDVITRAFEDENLSFKEIINKMLDEINKASEGIFHWKLTMNPGGDDKNLSIVDVNYVDGIGNGKDEDLYNKLFTFEVMGPNSIVKNFELSLDLADGDISNQYAISGLTGVGGQMFPVSALFDEHAVFEDLMKQPIVYENISSQTTQTVCHGSGVNRPEWKKYVSYVPSIGPNRGDHIINERQRSKIYADYYKDDDNIFIGGHTPDVGWGAMVDPRHFLSTELTPTQLSNGKKSNIDNRYVRQFMSSGELSELQTNLIESNDLRLRESDFAVTNDVFDYFAHEIRDDFFLNSRSSPLPLKLTITIYGISSLAPGDIFRVDYLPKIFVEKIYFQIIKMSQQVDSTGWYTTLETQFRVRPDKKNQNATQKPVRGRYLSPSFFVNKVDDSNKYVGDNSNPYNVTDPTLKLEQARRFYNEYYNTSFKSASDLSTEQLNDVGKLVSTGAIWARFPAIFTRKSPWKINYTKSKFKAVDGHIQTGNTKGKHEEFYNVPDTWMKLCTDVGLKSTEKTGASMQHFFQPSTHRRVVNGSAGELQMLYYSDKIVRARKIHGFNDLLSIITKVTPLSNIQYDHIYFVAKVEISENLNETPQYAMNYYMGTIVQLEDLTAGAGMQQNLYGAKRVIEWGTGLKNKSYAGKYEAAMVTNPSYYYRQHATHMSLVSNNSENGYGGVYSNGCKQGVYKPGETAYLILNNQDPKKFWALVPDIKGRRPGDALFKKFYDTDVSSGLGNPKNWNEVNPTITVSI